MNRENDYSGVISHKKRAEEKAIENNQQYDPHKGEDQHAYESNGMSLHGNAETRAAEEKQLQETIEVHGLNEAIHSDEVTSENIEYGAGLIALALIVFGAMCIGLKMGFLGIFDSQSQSNGMGFLMKAGLFLIFIGLLIGAGVIVL